MTLDLTEQVKLLCNTLEYLHNDLLAQIEHEPPAVLLESLGRVTKINGDNKTAWMELFAPKPFAIGLDEIIIKLQYLSSTIYQEQCQSPEAKEATKQAPTEVIIDRLWFENELNRTLPKHEEIQAENKKNQTVEGNKALLFHNLKQADDEQNEKRKIDMNGVESMEVDSELGSSCSSPNKTDG